eukprot:COSAG01_NODE_13638_length_1555_cov_1.052885_1_plen_69_part_10
MEQLDKTEHAQENILQWGPPKRKEDIQINTEPSPLKEVLEGWVTTAPRWRSSEVPLRITFSISPNSIQI